VLLRSAAQVTITCNWNLFIDVRNISGI